MAMTDAEWTKYLMDTIDQQEQMLNTALAGLKLATTLIDIYKKDEERLKVRIKELENDS